MTTKQALMELKRLSKEAVGNLYRRIELAATVLHDLDWIAQSHGGSDLKAQDALEGEFFRDLAGYVTLGKLIAMWRSVPKPKWEELRYNLQAVELLYDSEGQSEKQEGQKRTAWKMIAEELREKLESEQRRAAKLQAEVAGLEVENQRLHGRIEQLEKLLEREPVGA